MRSGNFRKSFVLIDTLRLIIWVISWQNYRYLFKLTNNCLYIRNYDQLDVSTEDMENVDLYMQCLRVPARRNVNDPEVQLGEQKIYEAKCHLCHVTTLHTRSRGSVLLNGTQLPWLGGQTIHPYSDFLLHDMGSEIMGVGLNDNLNAVTPTMMTGFDLGVEIHGMIKEKWGYQVGLFNGTGASTNVAGKTFSDDWHIPSLLYAGRITFQPWGIMPGTQGNPNQLNLNRLLVGASASLNVESENESTNDFRAGLELAWMHNRLYFAGEAYYMHVGFTKRQKIDQSFDYMGGYVQAGYFVTDRLQPALRYDFYDRNGLDKGGFLNMPAVGINYYFKGVNLKLQAMYRYIGRTGHETQLDRDNDDLGLATHNATVQIQYTF